MTVLEAFYSQCLALLIWRTLARQTATKRSPWFQSVWMQASSLKQRCTRPQSSASGFPRDMRHQLLYTLSTTWRRKFYFAHSAPLLSAYEYQKRSDEVSRKLSKPLRSNALFPPEGNDSPALWVHNWDAETKQNALLTQTHAALQQQLSR